MPTVDHKKLMDEVHIPRSSYKFCEFNYECEFNYATHIQTGSNNKRGCYAQHFVHNFINADINSVIIYLRMMAEKKTEINYGELLKCINTINFVINHMREEMQNMNCYYAEQQNQQNRPKIMHKKQNKIRKQKKI